jgi:hypothetical protein
MSDVDLSKLSLHEELREFLYHVRGLLEAHDNLVPLLNTLNETFDTDVEKAAETLSLLEIEIIDHLGYHRKEVRRPLAALVRRAHQAAEKSEEDAASAK